MANQDLTQKHLKSLFVYNKNTGIFYKDGQPHGSTTVEGYIEIRISNHTYKAHRLAFLYVLGCWPKHQVDHINHIKNDNRWINLRECTQGENSRNQKKYKNNKSGYKGVSWNKNHNKWVAQITYKRKVTYLGAFNCPKDAAEAYNKKAKELFGDFAYIEGGV